MAGDEIWLRKYRKNILQATGNGNISYINADDSNDRRFSMEVEGDEEGIMAVEHETKKIRSVFRAPLRFKTERQLRRQRKPITGAIRSRRHEDVFQILATQDMFCRTPTIINQSAISSNDDELYAVERDTESRKLNGILLKAIWDNDLNYQKWLLGYGANPNATCYESKICAAHIAAWKSYETLQLLKQNGADMSRTDDLGRTPLHFAAWAGNLDAIVLLTTPAEDNLINPQNNENTNEITIENDDKTIPMYWYDDYRHECTNVDLPIIQKSWTPLHAASSNVQLEAGNYLLSIGADALKCDDTGCTALDVIASSWQANDINTDHFSELITILIQSGGVFASTQEIRHKYNSPLHTALKLKSPDMLQILLTKGAQVDCIDESGDTVFHICVIGKLKNCLEILSDSKYIETSLLSKMINKKNNHGENVLHTALKSNWLPGVNLAMKFISDINSKNKDGNTAIHFATEIENINILESILSFKNVNKGLNHRNEKGETAFCRAVLVGHLICVERLFKVGADPLIPLKGNLTAIHISAKHGYVDILRFLLNIDGFKYMLNWQTSTEHEGFTPIHFAASYNHPDCVKILIAAGADIYAKSNFGSYASCTPLHEAVVKNNIEVITILIKENRRTMKEVDKFGWTPLHTASFFGSREAISILLKEGADIAVCTRDCKSTAIEFIMNNLSMPTEFLEDVFDYFITSNDSNVQAPNCLITIDHRIISSDNSLGQSKAIKALLATRNRFDQRRLLLHPLVESFVYLKWKSVLPLFYITVFLYTSFVLSLNIYIVSLFLCQDTTCISKSGITWFYEGFWKYVVYVTASFPIIHKLVSLKFKLSHFCQFEVLVTFTTIILAFLLPSLIEHSPNALDWLRHLATVALLLSWLQILLILSKFPQWGYYVQMFGKVSSIVVKVLLTFSFIVIGFSLSFMIQFHSQGSFKDPWNAFSKTMVMLMSEFDYDDLFSKQPNNVHTEINRILFTIFLIFGGIAFMNLLIGLAVNDLHFLEMQGHIRRIEMQVDFLASLDTMMENPILKYFLSKNTSYVRKKNLGGAMLTPGNPNWGSYNSIPPKLRNAIFLKIQTKHLNKSNKEAEIFKSKLEEIHNVVDKDVVVKIEQINAQMNDMADKIKSLEGILRRLDKNLIERKERSE